MAVVTISLTDANWTKLEGVDGPFTIRNKSGHPISIVRVASTDAPPTDESLAASGIDPVEIGGSIFEVSTELNQVAFAKAIDGQGELTIRPYGTLDPSEDITYLATLLDVVNNLIRDHRNDHDNPHATDKTQVGLGNIPNAKSDNPTLGDSGVLATTKATSVLNNAHIAHAQNKKNPHEVSKGQVGLGNVANYAPATAETCSDETRDDLYMTPKMTHTAVKSWIQINMAVAPQSIMKSKMGPRPVGWSQLDCSQPAIPVEKSTNTRLRINEGLVVAFADSGKVRESFELIAPVNVDLPANAADGIYYVAANLNEKAQFTSFNLTAFPYKEGALRDGHVGDFFDTARCVMFDSSDAPVLRVYIAKLVVLSGVITQVICAPVGDRTIIPATIPIILGGRDLYYNPFLGETDMYAEVEYNGNWGQTGWNDQIGVRAEPHQTGPLKRIILQSGLMGFLASGKESGSPFGASFPTVTTPLRARIVIFKR